MSVRRVECHPYAFGNAGRVALMRGPLLYCVEQIDNPGLDLRDLVLPDEVSIAVEHKPDLLNGVTVLRAKAEAVPAEGWPDRLYRTAGDDGPQSERRTVALTAVPYYAWANREPGPMQVWLRRR